MAHHGHHTAIDTSIHHHHGHHHGHHTSTKQTFKVDTSKALEAGVAGAIGGSVAGPVGSGIGFATGFGGSVAKDVVHSIMHPIPFGPGIIKHEPILITLEPESVFVPMQTSIGGGTSCNTGGCEAHAHVTHTDDHWNTTVHGGGNTNGDKNIGLDIEWSG